MKNNNEYILNKTKINSGLQCQKKLWFDFHKPIKQQEEYLIKAGNKFGEVIRDNYGAGLDLSETHNISDVVKKTNEALNSKNVDVIYEAGFIYEDTLVRSDVLRRIKNGWELLEAKGSKIKKKEHISDIAIQSFIIRSCGVNLTYIRLILINAEFIYQGKQNYKDLINDDEDITEEVNLEEKKVINHINQFKKLAGNVPNPKIYMGRHCDDPHICNYKDRCESLTPETNVTPYTILPYKSKKLIAFCENNKIKSLIDVPAEQLNVIHNHHKIQEAHKNNKPWFNPELKNIFKEFEWPFYFMDFESVQQKVPIIENTKPFYALPFQWSVHKWKDNNTKILLSEGDYFLNFSSQDIERVFLEKLLKVIGTKGTIFAHSASTEKAVLNRLKEKKICGDLNEAIDKLNSRVYDTVKLVRKNFYDPLMRGSYSLKNIIKAVPGAVSYGQKGDIGGGMGAQLSWLVCTDKKTSEQEKKKEENLLKDYCAKDTFNLYLLIKYLMFSSK